MDSIRSSAKGTVVALDLAATFNGRSDTLDAGNTVRALADLLTVLKRLSAFDRPNDPDQTGSQGWTFSHLQLSSVQTVLRPTFGFEDRIPLRLVAGLAAIRNTGDIPDEWTPEAIAASARLARKLDSKSGKSLTLAAVDGERVVRETVITEEIVKNLSAAIAPVTESIGSVVGTVGTITVHHKYSVSVWPDRQTRRVTVTAKPEQMEAVAALLGKRVEIRGRLKRNSAGRIVKVEMRGISEVPKSDFDLTSLWGSLPTITGGSTISEHLADIRGTA